MRPNTIRYRRRSRQRCALVPVFWQQLLLVRRTCQPEFPKLLNTLSFSAQPTINGFGSAAATIEAIAQMGLLSPIFRRVNHTILVASRTFTAKRNPRR